MVVSCRIQFLVKAGIVKKPPLWLAVVEAFPPLPTPSVTGTRTKEIVYKEEDKHRVSATCVPSQCITHFVMNYISINGKKLADIYRPYMIQGVLFCTVILYTHVTKS